MLEAAGRSAFAADDDDDVAEADRRVADAVAAGVTAKGVAAGAGAFRKRLRRWLWWCGRSGMAAFFAPRLSGSRSVARSLRVLGKRLGVCELSTCRLRLLSAFGRTVILSSTGPSRRRPSGLRSRERGGRLRRGGEGERLVDDAESNGAVKGEDSR